MAKESDSGPDNWKYKYLEALDELESKERAWQASDQVLRRGLNRVSLISVGVDSTLDQHLSKLRRSLQKDVTPSVLNNVIENIAERVKTLDEQRENNAALFEPAGVLMQVVETIHFPRHVISQVTDLKKRLKQSDASGHLDELVDAFSQLVVAAFYPSSPSEDAVVTVDASEPETKGWWKTLFSPQDAGALQSPPLPDGNVDTDMPVEEVFLEILECMVFPQKFSDRVQHLKEQLSVSLGADSVTPMTQDIVALVVDMRADLENEKEELEHFLMQLTRRLGELDSMVEGAESNRMASLAGVRQLDAMIKGRVTDIEATVHNVHDVDQMKSAIQVSLDKIREHLAEQRAQEEQCQGSLEDQLKALALRLHQVEEESQSLRDKLAEKHIQATTDPLTGAPNRLAYEKRLALEYARWQRYQHPLSLLLCDVDHFKQVNDTYGHKAGDRALMAIVKTIKHYLRESDFLARVGGEEFIILLPNTPLQDAKKAADKLRRSIESSEFAYQGQPVPITISAGLAGFRQGDTVDAVYQRADKGLYRAKHQGRNRIVVAD